MFLKLSHTKLDAFKDSQGLTLACYRITKTFPSDEKYAMVQQIRRAALSVHLNLAEGSSRRSAAERRRYFEVARGSLVEVDAAIGVAYELGYVDMNSIEDLGKTIVKSFKQLTGLIKSCK